MRKPSRVEAVIAVERGDDLHVGRERPYVALLELVVRMRERLIEARDLHAGETLGRVEPPLGDSGVDDAPDGGRADLERFRDLLVGKAGNEEVENGLPPIEVFGPALFRQGPPSAR